MTNTQTDTSNRLPDFAINVVCTLTRSLSSSTTLSVNHLAFYKVTQKHSDIDESVAITRVLGIRMKMKK